MSSMDYLPRTDVGLRNFAQNFSTLISADPVSFGLSAPIATTLAGLYSAYDSALTAALNPPTRGVSTIAAKTTAANELRSYIRHVAMQIQGTMTVTDQQRTDLGLTVHDPEPSPIPVPSSSPGVSIAKVSAYTATIKLKDVENPDRRGKPDGVVAAVVMTYVGEAPPTDVTKWKLEGHTTRMTVNVVFPSSLPAGSTVWVSAYWLNAKMKSGPASAPIATNLPGWAVPEADPEAA